MQAKPSTASCFCQKKAKSLILPGGCCFARIFSFQFVPQKVGTSKPKMRSFFFSCRWWIKQNQTTLASWWLWWACEVKMANGAMWSFSWRMMAAGAVRNGQDFMSPVRTGAQAQQQGMQGAKDFGDMRSYDRMKILTQNFQERRHVMYVSGILRYFKIYFQYELLMKRQELQETLKRQRKRVKTLLENICTMCHDIDCSSCGSL